MEQAIAEQERTILIIDDNVWTREVVADSLRAMPQLREEWKILTTGDGADGSQIITQREPCLVVIADCDEMATCTGKRVIETTKQQFPSTKIIGTSYSQAQLINLLDNGADGVLLKPSAPVSSAFHSELYSLVRILLELE